MRFQIRRSNNYRQPYYWRMVARNGEVLATSETYTTKQGCQNAIAVVKREAGGGIVDDLT